MFHGTLPGNRHSECYTNLYLQNDNKQSKCVMAHSLATGIQNATLIYIFKTTTNNPNVFQHSPGQPSFRMLHSYIYLQNVNKQSKYIMAHSQAIAIQNATLIYIFKIKQIIEMCYGTLPGNCHSECYTDLYLQNENQQSKYVMAYSLATTIQNATLINIFKMTTNYQNMLWHTPWQPPFRMLH